MHPRLTPTNGRVAHVSLRGEVDAELFTEGHQTQIAAPVADLLRKPDGGLDKQLLHGADFLVLEPDIGTGYVFGQSSSDGYVGYLSTGVLEEPSDKTHKVSALATHIYKTPDIKSRVRAALPFGAGVSVRQTEKTFHELRGGGFIPAQHLVATHQNADDFIAVFERFMGVPYLWGGNSTWGMDCSGAVQLALEAAGNACPRDTDMQQADLGTLLPEDAALLRGDLVFWNGHVGVMQDSETLLHANAHHMAVASEPLVPAVKRILKNGGGPITARKRL